MWPRVALLQFFKSSGIMPGAWAPGWLSTALSLVEVVVCLRYNSRLVKTGTFSSGILYGWSWWEEGCLSKTYYCTRFTVTTEIREAGAASPTERTQVLLPSPLSPYIGGPLGSKSVTAGEGVAFSTVQN
jgi:hypothetical protein